MLIAVALALAAPDASLNLQLLCTGIGAQTKATFDPSPYNPQRETETVIEDVRIDLTGDGGRIHIPAAMMPPVHGGKNGWFDLHNTVSTRDEITASGNINPFNHVRVRLNRLNGGLMLTVLHGQYTGTCHPFTDDTPRAF